MASRMSISVSSFSIPCIPGSPGSIQLRLSSTPADGAIPHAGTKPPPLGSDTPAAIRDGRWDRRYP